MRLLLFVLPLAALLTAAQPVDFNRDVRPILSDHCFMCHGPDAAHREAGVRFDIEGDAKRLRTAILSRTTSLNPAEQMPPPDSGKPRLTPNEVAILQQWVRSRCAMATLLVLHPAQAKCEAQIDR